MFCYLSYFHYIMQVPLFRLTIQKTSDPNQEVFWSGTKRVWEEMLQHRNIVNDHT